MDDETDVTTKKPLISQDILDTFWKITEGNDEKRIEATQKLLHILLEKQQQHKKPCKELDYAVTRLVRGLASHRKWARVGYTVALTQILRQFSAIKAELVLDKVKNELKTTRSDAKSEQSNATLGRVMAYISLISSMKLLEAPGETVSELVSTVLAVSQDKLPLNQICTRALQDIIINTPHKLFKKHVWPQLKETLSAGWRQSSPQSILLLVTACKHHKSLITEEFLDEHWNGGVLNEANFPHMVTVLANSTLDHPVVHGVGAALIAFIAQQKDLLPSFWCTVIDNGLLAGNIARKYLALHLVPIGLRHISSEHVGAVISDGLLRVILRSLQNKDKILYNATRKLTEDLIEVVSESKDGAMQVAVMQALLQPPSSYQFDNNTKTRTIFRMTSKLTAEGVEKWASLLKTAVLGNSTFGRCMEEQEEDAEMLVNWAMSSLTTLATVPSVADDEEFHLDIAQFLCLHSFFEVKNTTKTIPHCDMKAQAFDDFVNGRKHIRDAFYKYLNKLSTYRQGKFKQQNTAIELLHNVVLYANVLTENKKNVSPLTEFDEDTREEWNKMIETVTKIRSKFIKDNGKMGEGHAFELLFLHLGLQLFTEPGATVDALQDLHVCCDKALARRRTSMMKSDKEPDWVEVVTELLLSLMSQQSHLVRVVATTVFGILSSHLHSKALHILLDVLVKSDASEDDVLAFEDDDDEDDEDDENEEEDSGDSEGENDKDEEEGDDEDEEDEEDGEDEEEEEEEEDVNTDPGGIEMFRASVKQALGPAAADSDEDDDASSEDDFDDEAMFRLDKVLAAAFRAQYKGKGKAEKDRATQMRHYKLRCLDLVSALVSSQPPPSILLELLVPLLDLMDAGAREKELRELGEKAAGVFNRIVKSRKGPVSDHNVEKDTLPEVITNLINYSTSVSGVPQVKHVASAIVFVVRMMLGLEDIKEPSPIKTRSRRLTEAHLIETNGKDADSNETNFSKVMEKIKQSIGDFCEKRDSHLNHMLFHTILERLPVLFWPLTDDLLSMILKKDIRVFCRTQVCSMLSAMIHKSTVQQLSPEEWQKFTTRLAAELILHLESMIGSEVKPRYTYEVLLLLQRSLVASTGQLKDVLPENTVPVLCEFQKQLRRKDTRSICNQILNRLGYTPEKIKPKKAEKRKLDKDDDTAKSSRKNETEDHDGDTAGSSVKKKKKKSHKTKEEEPAEAGEGSPVNGYESPDRTETKSKKKNKHKQKKHANMDSNETPMDTSDAPSTSVKEVNSSSSDTTTLQKKVKKKDKKKKSKGAVE